MAIAILMIVFIGGLNFVLDEYAKGAIHTAVDDAACQAEARQVQGNLLPGPFGGGISVTCSEDGVEMVASARGALPSLLPLVPRVHISLVGISIIAETPSQ